jgi:hypothetical protein
VSWTLAIASAPWAARYGHTSVVDAAGTIYVIGGSGGFGTTFYQDVWVSTDGGARAGLGQGTRVGTMGVFGATRGYSRYSGGALGTLAVLGVLWGTHRATHVLACSKEKRVSKTLYHRITPAPIYIHPQTHVGVALSLFFVKFNMRGCVCAIGRFARVGRRRDVDEPYE